MAFNNHSRHYQRPATSQNAERDEFGYSDEEYVRMMATVATAIVDGNDEVLSTPSLYLANEEPQRPAADTARFPNSYSTDFSNHQHGASYDIPSPGGRRRGSVQRERGTHRPGASSHRGGSFNSQGGSRLHPYSRYQQPVPPTAHSDYRKAYPTPPVAWLNGSDSPSLNNYQDSRPSNYGAASTSDLFAQHNASSFSSGRSQRRVVEPGTLPLSWKRSQFPRPAMPTPQILPQSTHYSSSGWHRNPAGPASAQRFAVMPNDPSPYAPNVQYGNSDSRTQINARSAGQRLPAQASHRWSRRSTVLAVGDEFEDGRRLSEEEADEEADEEEGLPTTRGTKKPGNASESKTKVRRGLTRINPDGELEWLATVDSEWVLAIAHDDIRPQLIAITEAERIALGVEYEHPDEPGPGQHNVTSFYRKHVPWGPDREHRPEIDFDWEEDKEKNPRPKVPGYMYWKEDGKKYIVLDPHDNPVKDWDIPSTIASNIPGYKLEAMRRENMSLGRKDFWARMQSRINVGNDDEPIWEELGHPNSLVNMPMERFRFHAGLCSWTERKKTLIIKAGLQKLYGNKLQNNTVRAFGRDLTTKEIQEIKKGDNAVFPVEGDSVPETRKAAKKDRGKGGAKPTKPKGNANVEKARSQKRKHAIENDGQSSEGEALTQLRSHKRARQVESIATEVDDLVMFEQSPAVVDEADATRRYSLRSTRTVAKTPRKVEQIEELAGESSADEEYTDAPTHRHSLGRTRKLVNSRENSKRVEQASSESSAEEEDEYIPAQPSYPIKRTKTNEESHRKYDRVEAASRKSSVETDGEEAPAPRFPFGRIPRAGEAGGKSKGPSWVSSAEDQRRSIEDTDYRHTAVPVSIGGRVHYATYEGLISNGPAHSVDGSDSLSKGQTSKAIGASLAQKGPYSPESHAFEAMMKTPILEEKNLEEADTPLQAHRKWVRDFLGDEEAEARAPPLKSLYMEQPVLPLPESATQGDTSNVPPKADQCSSAPSVPHTQSSQTGKQKLEAEWAQVFENTFVDLGYRTVNYSEVAPWNEEEVQSLIDALLPTREVYLAWTGEAAPRTDPQQSYRAQFDTIFGAFQYWWREHRSNEALPTLAGVMHWGRSVEDWEPPSKDSIYYEAFKKGHRARREAKGKMVDLANWSGSRLEEDVVRRWPVEVGKTREFRISRYEAD